MPGEVSMWLMDLIGPQELPKQKWCDVDFWILDWLSITIFYNHYRYRLKLIKQRKKSSFVLLMSQNIEFSWLLALDNEKDHCKKVPNSGHVYFSSNKLILAVSRLMRWWLTRWASSDGSRQKARKLIYLGLITQQSIHHNFIIP